MKYTTICRDVFHIAVLALALLPTSTIAEELYITPSSQTESASLAANATRIFTARDFERSSALTLDDFLRTEPSFQIFRRASSLVANPTTQGATLRGIGPSAASRALVLLDGQPLNDPFGGWTIWSSIPLDDIERIEIHPGGGTHVAGSGALAGVIRVISRTTSTQQTKLRGEFGSNSLRHVNASLVRHEDSLGVGLSARHVAHNGYRIVSPDDRGAIDGRADSESTVIRLRTRVLVRDDTELQTDISTFFESRDNGTPLTGNATRFTRAVVRLGSLEGETYPWHLSLLAQQHRYSSTFSAQAADRNSESLVVNQYSVPSTRFRLRAEKALPLLTIGTVVDSTAGETRELFLPSDGEFTRERVSGGKHILAGLFARNKVDLSTRTRLNSALRFDYWRSRSGNRSVRDLETGQTLSADSTDDRSQGVLTGHISLSSAISESFSLSSSVYQTFRSPFLNEQYRSFRVRNDITAANANLSPERLLGLDFGMQYVRDTWSLSVTPYVNIVYDLITNARAPANADGTSPCGFVPEGGICRQRENIGRTSVYGIESKAHVQFNDKLSARLSHAWRKTNIEDGPSGSEIIDRELAQVPEHVVSSMIVYTAPDLISASLEARFVGTQYEDDRNERELDEYFLLSAYAGIPLSKTTTLTARIENILDTAIDTGVTADGVTTTGQPLLLSVGARVSF